MKRCGTPMHWAIETESSLPPFCDAAASAAERAAQLIAEGALSRKDIVKKLRDEFGISRNEAYELVHGA